MGEISEDQVEWAVVNRLKAMLDEPPKTKFNVTQTFAHFTTVMLWSTQRVRNPNPVTTADVAAKQVWDGLKAQRIVETPWLLSRATPKFPKALLGNHIPLHAQPINADFDAMNAAAFVKWLRDALAHGDGRTIRPIHKPSQRGNTVWLAGFEIVFPRKKGAAEKLNLQLYHADMKRIGAGLAHAFCHALSGGDKYFEKETGTRSIKETA